MNTLEGHDSLVRPKSARSGIQLDGPGGINARSKVWKVCAVLLSRRRGIKVVPFIADKVSLELS